MSLIGCWHQFDEIPLKHMNFLTVKLMLSFMETAMGGSSSKYGK